MIPLVSYQKKKKMIPLVYHSFPSVFLIKKLKHYNSLKLLAVYHTCFGFSK